MKHNPFIDAINKAFPNMEKIYAELEEQFEPGVIRAAVKTFGMDHAIKALNQGAYRGRFKSVGAYAESVIADLAILNNDLLKLYFDYDAFTRDLGHDVHFIDGYIFDIEYGPGITSSRSIIVDDEEDHEIQ